MLAFLIAVAGLDPLAAAVGLWELDPVETKDRGVFTCAQKPIRIEIDPDAMRYVSHQDGKSFPATILEFRDDAFLLRYDVEERLDPNGEPVEWWLVIAGPDHFAWMRKDWEGNRTPMRRRCKETPVS